MSSAVLSKPGAKRGTSSRPRSQKLAGNRMTQMNVRIEESLKAAGDRAWAHLGLTPSDMVRALWEYGARALDNPDELRQLAALLEAGAPHDEPSVYEKRRQAAQEGRQALDEAYRAFGASPHVPENTTERLAYYDTLLEEALEERLAERSPL